jgi:hypothetical protein
MRRILLFAAALTAFALVGIASAAKPVEVTISLARPAVVYGGSVKLSGTVSTHQAGEAVTVLGRQYGTTGFIPLNVVTTTAKGAWSYVASPVIQTSYEAHWGAASSRMVNVKVRPRIRLSLQSRTANRGTFSVVVDGNHPFAGKRVLVQRLTTTGPSTVKSVKLDATSSATFTLRLPKHNARVRVVMSSAQAAPGYIGGYSNVWKSS